MGVFCSANMDTGGTNTEPDERIKRAKPMQAQPA